MAIGIFLLASPTSALACVTPAQCTGGGGIPNSPAGFCGGGVFGGQQICSGGGNANASTFSVQCNGPGANAQACASIVDKLRTSLDRFNELKREQREIKNAIIWGLVWSEGGTTLILEGEEIFADELKELKKNIQTERANINAEVNQIKANGGVIIKQDPLVMPAAAYSGQSITESIQGGYAFDLNANQSLTTRFSIAHNQANFSDPTGTSRAESWGVTAGAGYRAGRNYLIGTVTANLGHGSFQDTIAGAAGNFGTHGYLADIAAGHRFSLWQAPRWGTRTRKARAIPVGLLGVDLDVQGHYGYARAQANAFTDTTGLMWGTNDIHASILGAQATLIGYYGTYNGLLMPYFMVGVDQYLGYSHTLDVPAQLNGPADAYLFSDAKTWGNIEAGVKWATLQRFVITASAWYKFSSDMNVTGGKVSLRIPFF